jgi:pSer/pThr/pTyr-binding forkhead associated (FHA) protein
MYHATGNSAAGDRPTLPATAPRLRLATSAPGTSCSCEIKQPVTLLGSRRDCDLSLFSPEVSKVHAAVLHTGRSVVVRDLGSRCGTYVNDHPVRTAVLHAGDRLRLGNVEVAVHGVTDAGDTTPARKTRHVAKAAAHIGPATTPSAALAGARIASRTPFAGITSREDGEVRDENLAPANAADATTPPADASTAADIPVTLLVGRRHTCDIVICNPDVSLVHAIVFPLSGERVVCDLGSRSGTFVNGRRVHLAWLRAGDKLRITDEILTLPAAPRPGLADTAFQREHHDLARQDQSAMEHLLRAVVDDLSATRHKMQLRENEVARREAELDARAAMLSTSERQLEQSRADLAAQLAAGERMAAEARVRAADAETRAAAAAEKEEAFHKAWAEMERCRQALGSALPGMSEPFS